MYLKLFHGISFLALAFALANSANAQNDADNISVADLKKQRGVLEYAGVWDWENKNTSSISFDPNSSDKITYIYNGVPNLLPYTLKDDAKGNAVLVFAFPTGQYAQFKWTSLNSVKGKFFEKGTSETGKPFTQTTMKRVTQSLKSLKFVSVMLREVDGDKENVITADEPHQLGYVWTSQKIDFSKDFTISADIYLGTKDAGADGLALVFQNQHNKVVNDGGGLGYYEISPSLAIEFDTYQNTDLKDPVEDHVGIQFDGDVAHNNSDKVVEVGDLEDGKYHPIKFSWNASTKRFDVSLDGRVVFRNQNLPASFAGSKEHYFGFTGATGDNTNLQKVRSIVLDGVVSDEAANVVSVANLKARGKLQYKGTWDWARDGVSTITLDANEDFLEYTYGDLPLMKLRYKLKNDAGGKAVLNFELEDKSQLEFHWQNPDTVTGSFWVSGKKTSEEPNTRVKMKLVK